MRYVVFILILIHCLGCQLNNLIEFTGSSNSNELIIKNIFPRNNSLLDGLSSIEVVISIKQDNGIPPDDLLGVKINNVNANLISGSDHLWTATVPISSLNTEYPISTVISRSGEDPVSNTVYVNSNSVLYRPTELVAHSDNNTLYIIDQDGNKLVKYDISTQSLSPIYTFPTGNTLRSLLLNSAETRLYFTSGTDEALYEVEIDTGNITTISSAGVGAGNNFDAPWGAKFNSTETVVYVDSRGADEFLAVDISTGDRTVFSNNSDAGPTIVRPYGLEVNNAATKAYFMETTGSDLKLVEIDIASGNRTTISDEAVHGGTNWIFPTDITLNAAESLAYVVDTNENRISSTNLTTGFRNVVSDNGSAGDPFLCGPNSVAFNSTETEMAVLDSCYGIFNVNVSTGERTTLFTLDSQSRGSGPKFDIWNASRIDFDITEKNAYLVTSQKILKVNLESGDREEVSGDTVGTGDSFNPFGYLLEGLMGPIIGDSKETLYVCDNDFVSQSLYSVRLSDGYRTRISGGATGSGDPFVNGEMCKGIYVNSSESIVYVTQSSYTNPGKIFSVNTSNGARQIISDSVTGVGPDLDYPAEILLNDNETKLYVLNFGFAISGQPELIEVDIATGDRVSTSGNGSGSGVSFGGPRGLRFGSNSTVAYVYDLVAGGEIQINLSNGARTLTSSLDPSKTISSYSSMTYNPEDKSYIFLEQVNNQALVELSTYNGQRVVVSK